MTERSADVAVLGAGPAGLGAAYRLAAKGHEVVLLEAASQVGGLAGSVEVAGMRVDFGSHRLHPSIAPEILDELNGLDGIDLQRRPRHGRIRLAGRWIGFPLAVPDALAHLPPRLSAGLVRDAVLAPLRFARTDTFEAVLRAGVGPTLAERFYFPYARKIWGLAPAELSGEQARRRVSANSLVKIALRALRGQRETPWFWYPTAGFGVISEALERHARALGADIRLQHPVIGLERDHDGWTVRTASGAPLSARHVWNTLPLPALTGMLTPPPEAELRAAADGLRYRGMLLIYLALRCDRYTSFDAHYFPEAWTPVTRISEPKNYRDGPDPSDITVLCAELPCAPDDRWWSASDDELAQIVVAACVASDLQPPTPEAVVVHRRRHAYPIATPDSVERLGRLERWLAAQPDLVTLGRQGLFAHDNTHHALAMAWAAADALDADGTFDHQAWAAARGRFRTHVVED